MNSENSKTSKPHVLILNLTDKIDLQRGEKVEISKNNKCVRQYTRSTV